MPTTYKGKNCVVVTDLGPHYTVVQIWLGGNKRKWVFRDQLKLKLKKRTTVCQY